MLKLNGDILEIDGVEAARITETAHPRGVRYLRDIVGEMPDGEFVSGKATIRGDPSLQDELDDAEDRIVGLEAACEKAAINLRKLINILTSDDAVRVNLIKKLAASALDAVADA